MEQQFPTGARRNEDIALDLLKLIAGSTQVIRPSAGAAGFGAASATKADDQITTLIDLYKRCLSAVSGK